MAIQTLYPAINPSLSLDFANTKALDPRITFVRTTTGVFYNGVTTAKAEENLLLQSQDFTTTWSIASATRVADNQTAPDGTSTADTITATAANAQHFVNQAITPPTGTVVFSVFAKAGTHPYIQLFFATQTTSFANFDLTAGSGATGTSGNITSSSIVDAGNGWYRCVVVLTNTNISSAAIGLVDSASAVRNPTWNALGTETVFLWGAQLEQRSAVTAYTPTTTQPITNYIPVLLTAASGVARFDHNPTTGESLGLLVEEQRTNLQVYSEDFTNADWSKGSNTTITGNTNVAPDGTLTADTFGFTAITSGNCQVHDNQTKAASAITYTGSIYVKATSGLFLHFFVDANGTANSGRVIVSTSNWSVFSSTNAGTFTGTSGTVTPVGNGWYRITCTTTSGTETNIRFNLFWSTASNSVTFTPVGTEQVFIWGAQLEVGAFPTSYIPTVAATVTRNADAASMTGTNFSSWYRQGEGTLYWNGSGVDAFGRSMLSISDNTTSNRIRMVWTTSNARVINTEIVTSGTFQGSAPSSVSTITTGQQYKLSFAYNTNDLAGSRDGGAVGTDTSALIPVVDRMFIGAGPTGAFEYFGGHIRKISFYPSRISDAQLQALTTV
jgi:hypothetical protein